MPSIPYLTEALEEYLVEQEYAAGTVRAYTSVARRVLHELDENGSPPPSTTKGRAAIKHLMATTTRADLGDDWHEALVEYQIPPDQRTPLQARRERERKKRRQTRSYTEDDWRALWLALEKEGTPEAAVLLVLMATGLRISEVLELRYDQLREALETGDLRLRVKGQRERQISVVGIDPWLVLYRRFIDARPTPKTVALLVSPTGNGDATANGAAYHRVHRYLKKIHKALKLRGRAHLHRLRRSMAVYALRETEDVIAVQQLLGHRSYHSTMRYLDEAQPERVNDIQQRTLRRVRGIDPPTGENE